MFATAIGPKFNTRDAIALRESIVDLRTNDLIDYAVVLPDSDFKSWLFFPSRADALRLQIPGLQILTDHDVRQNVLIFERAPRHHVLYLKLPKEGLFIEASEFQDRVVQSELGEFISVLARLGAQSVTVNFVNGLVKDSSAHFLVPHVGAHAEMTTAHNGSKQWIQRFADTQTIHPDAFKDPVTYFYLPKHPDWVDLITNRLQYSGLEARYTYRHCSRSAASAGLIAKLKGFGVDCNFSSSALSCSELDYEIIYYPLKEKSMFGFS